MKFEQARKAIRDTYIRSDNLVKTAEKTLHAGLRSQQISLLSEPDATVLWDLFLEFCVRHRNKVAHGIVEKIFDDAVVQAGVCINRNLVSSVERCLRQASYSGFDKPTQWGAPRGNHTFSGEEIRALKIGGDAKEPLAVTNVLQKLGAMGLKACSS
jgi:hypothetical protein